MTPIEYRKKKEREKEIHDIVRKLVCRYHLTEQEALRFYWERIANKNE